MFKKFNQKVIEKEKHTKFIDDLINKIIFKHKKHWTSTEFSDYIKPKVIKKFPYQKADCSEDTIQNRMKYLGHSSKCTVKIAKKRTWKSHMRLRCKW